MWYYCKVTRMLVSYDVYILDLWLTVEIARSPECWWVTTNHNYLRIVKIWLQGHQNVGELRLLASPNHKLFVIAGSPECWWVTTDIQKIKSWPVKLQGHQNVGELRHFFSELKLERQNCRVTRMLVSYVNNIVLFLQYSVIEGS